MNARQGFEGRFYCPPDINLNIKNIKNLIDDEIERAIYNKMPQDEIDATDIAAILLYALMNTFPCK